MGTSVSPWQRVRVEGGGGSDGGHDPVAAAAAVMARTGSGSGGRRTRSSVVGRCRLTAAKPVLKLMCAYGSSA